MHSATRVEYQISESAKWTSNILLLLLFMAATVTSHHLNIFCGVYEKYETNLFRWVN